MDRLCINKEDSKQFCHYDDIGVAQDIQLCVWMEEPAVPKDRYLKLRAAVVHMRRAKESYHRTEYGVYDYD